MAKKKPVARRRIMNSVTRPSKDVEVFDSITVRIAEIREAEAKLREEYIALHEERMKMLLEDRGLKENDEVWYEIQIGKHMVKSLGVLTIFWGDRALITTVPKFRFIPYRKDGSLMTNRGYNIDETKLDEVEKREA